MAANTATSRRSVTATSGHGLAQNVKCLVATIELAAASSGDTIDFGKIKSNARILGASTVYFDDLATSGSPTLDLGLVAVNSNITSDPDALTDGVDVTSAGNAKVVKDAANYALPAWDYVNGQSTDPGGELTVQGVIKDAGTTTTGTVTLELLYTLD